jgi:MiaB/RimO family radical SAM methylthiotransferase
MKNMKNIFMTADVTCAVSDYDASLVAEFFRNNGYNIVDKPLDAEMILINTCGSDEYRERKSLNLIKKVCRRFSKTKKIVIFGCLPKQRYDILKEIPGVILIGPRELNKFNDLIKAKKPMENVSTNRIIDIKQKATDQSPYSQKKYFYISICKGCLGKCNFCAIKKAKGSVTSKPIDKVLEEFDMGLKLGYERFALLGDDVGCYGMDKGIDLSVLLSEMLKRDGDYKISLHYVDPQWLVKLYPKLRGIFKTNKICSTNIPIQSGSNRILKLMGRGYRIGDVIKNVAEMKKMSNVNIATDILFGFPSETMKEFEDSIKAASVFDEVIFYAFSERMGTSASKISRVSHEATRNGLKDKFKTILNLRSKNPKKYILGYLGYCSL